MDDFKLDCTTEIKTHDVALAKKLLEHLHESTEHQLGFVVGYNRIAGYASQLLTFKLIKDNK